MSLAFFSEIQTWFLQHPYGIGLLILAGIFLLWLVRRTLRRWRMALMRRQGVHGEEHALRWLRAHGFHHIQTHVSYTFQWWVGTQQRKFKVQPDILALDVQDRPWVIEVKTGQSAFPGYRYTRRQLREYAMHFPEHYVALFQADQSRLIPVSFDHAHVTKVSLASVRRPWWKRWLP